MKNLSAQLIYKKPNKSNGNISWMITDLPEIGRQQNSPAKSMQAMLYDYDQLNRITAARSLTAYNPGSGFAQRTNPIEAYDVDYSYDPNGNLLTLQRMDEQGALMDDFTYSYYSNSNKLKQTSPVDEDKIYESGAVTSDNKVYRNIFLRGSAYVPSGSTVELKAFEKINMSPDFKVHSGANFKAKIWKEEDGIYQYDAIGNLIADLDEGVKIKWTPYGKVREVQKGDSTTIYYKYDGTGNRIEKSVFNGIDTVTTRYIRDASGNVLAIYNDTLMTEQPIYGSSRLGMYRGGDSTGMRTLGYKNYELSNHLGNVLAVVTDNIYMDGDSTMAGVISTNDYYSFGLGMAGRSWNDSTYRYGFNGQEKDDEIKGSGNSYSFTYRIHDPRLGRFLSVDPLSKEYSWTSPYAFAENSPIAFIDLEGLESYWAADGTKLGNVGNNDEIRIVNSAELSNEKAIELIHNARPPWVVAGAANSKLLSSSTALRYDVGKKEDKESGTITGITGNSFSKDHPLYPKRKEITGKFATVYGSPVRESDLADYTEVFSKVLKEGEDVFAPSSTGPWKVWFAYKVTDDGDYDLKSTLRSNTDVPSFAAVKIGEWSLNGGKLTRYDDYGNISYGYWGKLYGFDRQTLLKAADQNQDTKNGKTTSGVGDEQRDKDSINRGVDLAERHETAHH